jgi:hypothetical protein
MSSGSGFLKLTEADIGVGDKGTMKEITVVPG